MEQSSSGRSNIIFEHVKFNESYILKSGVIVWQCFVKNCWLHSLFKDSYLKNIIIATNKNTVVPHPEAMGLLSFASPTRTADLQSAPPKHHQHRKNLSKRPTTTLIEFRVEYIIHGIRKTETVRQGVEAKEPTKCCAGPLYWIGYTAFRVHKWGVCCQHF